MLVFAALFLFTSILAAQPDTGLIPINEVPAASRDKFESWEAETIGQVAAVLKEDPHGRRAEPFLRSLQDAQVDWSSFLSKGDKNFEFPNMLYYNEFYLLPKYYANPSNVVRRLTGHVRESFNGRPDGSVPHSSFFTNTCIESYTPEWLIAEIESLQPQGKLTVTKVKKNRTSEGIWVKDEQERTFIVIFDPPFAPEMTTSAEFIGSTLMRMAGYNVPRTCICIVNGTGDPLYDGRRAVATLSLDHFKGGYRLAPFRSYREVRGLRLHAAWINNVDQTEQNTGMTVDQNDVCRHYVLDFGASLGSFTFRPQLARLGWTRMFDAYEQFTQPLYDRGWRKVPWEAPYKVQSPAVGYFTTNFDPDRWQPFYTNMAFIEESPEDRIWAARRIARFSDEQIETVVNLAGYSHPEDARYITQVLIARRDAIVRHYLAAHP